MYTIDESLSDTDFTPAAVVAQAFGTSRSYESITVHHWGSFGQTHDGVVAFFMRPNSPTSCHYVASDSRIHCLVSPLDASWAAGNAYGNATSIHIEARPEATDGDYATVAWLIAHLRSIYGDLPLKPHNAWAATACPGKWDLARLDREARSAAAPITQSGDITVIPSDPLASKEDDMPLSSADLEAIQGIVQTERATTVSEVRANATAVSNTVKSEAYDGKVFNQKVMNQNGDRIIHDDRAQIAGLTEVVKQLAQIGGASIDLDKVFEAAKRGAEQAIAEGIVQVEISIAKPELETVEVDK